VDDLRLKARIERALMVAVKYGGIDGDHHKSWVIDRMIRELTGCPTIQEEGIDVHGKKYTYSTLGESEEYKELVRKVCEGKDGPMTYSWKVGIPPITP